MDNRTNNIPNSFNLRQKAEAQLMKKKSKMASQLSEADTLKLIQELEIHQIELKMQCEELIHAKLKAESSEKLSRELLQELITIKKKSEESELKYRDLVQHSPSIIYKYSLVKGSLFWSDSVRNILGYNPSEIGNNPFLWRELIHPDYKEIVQNAIENDELGDNFSIEYRIKTKDGRWIWLYNNVLRRSIIGNERIIEGYAIDITERKEYELALATSENKYRLLSENITDVIWILNVSLGKFTYISPSVFQLRGYTAEEALEQDIYKSLTKESALKVLNDLPIHLAEFKKGVLKSYVHQLEQPCKDGSIKSIETVTKYQYSKDGTIELIGVSRDITERKQAEQKLIISENKYRTIIETASDAIVTITKDLKFVTGNGYFLEKLNRTENEIVGKSLFDFFPKEIAENAKIWVDEVINSKTSLSYENETVLPSGKLFIEVKLSPILNCDGEVEKILMVSRDISASKKTEQDLRQSEEKYRKIIETTFEGFCLCDLKGNLVDVNPSYCSLIGYTKEELLKMAIADIEAIESKQETELRIKKVTEEGSALFETIHKRKDGKLVYVEVNASYFPLDKSQFVIFIHDITARKTAEQALKESEEHLKLLIHGTLDYYFRLKIMEDGSATMDYISDNYKLITGKDINNVQTLESWKNIIHSDDTEKVYDAFGLIIKTRKKINIECRSFAIGEVRNVEISCVPIVDENLGKVIYILGTVKDITFKKNAEQALKDNETKFKEIINQINDGIAVFNEQGKIVIWNKGIEKITGLKSTEVIDQNMADIQYQLFVPYTREKSSVQSTLKSIIEFEKPEFFNRFINDEIVAQNTKEIRNVQSIIFPVKFDDFNLFCAVMRDVTEIKKYEKQLLQLNANKDRFITILAHDLKNPFNALLGLSELLAKNIQTYDQERNVNLANIIYQTSRRTYKLLEELLLWAGAQSGKIPFAPQKINFIDICTKTVEALESNSSSKNITINYSIHDEIYLFADSNMLKTVMRNLVSNSIKFCKSGSTIEISIAENLEKATITILDNGVGIPEDIKGKLFDISQNHTTLGTDEEKGTGLGLIICKEFVEKQGGNIWFESELGKGSKFCFTIPLFVNKK